MQLFSIQTINPSDMGVKDMNLTVKTRQDMIHIYKQTKKNICHKKTKSVWGKSDWRNYPYYEAQNKFLIHTKKSTKKIFL